MTAVRGRIEEERERGKASYQELMAIANKELMAIAKADRLGPDRDTRTSDEILGHDERGLPS